MNESPIWAMFPENYQRTETPVTFMERYMHRQAGLIQDLVEELLVEKGVDVSKGWIVQINDQITQNGTFVHHYLYNGTPLAAVTFNCNGIKLYTQWKEK